MSSRTAAPGSSPKAFFWIRRLQPGCTVEVLIPDFKGDWAALQIVMEAKPEILNHNTETVARLYKTVRPQARYTRSLELLQRAKQSDPLALTKSGIMLGLGETWEEILVVMDDLRAHDVDIMTVGQYLQPSRFHLPIVGYYTPEQFDLLALSKASKRGFRWMESGPLVRSSYHADGQAHLSRARRCRRCRAIRNLSRFDHLGIDCLHSNWLYFGAPFRSLTSSTPSFAAARGCTPSFS